MLAALGRRIVWPNKNMLVKIYNDDDCLRFDRTNVMAKRLPNFTVLLGKTNEQTKREKHATPPGKAQLNDYWIAKKKKKPNKNKTKNNTKGFKKQT
jgi:hypothetical protein